MGDRGHAAPSSHERSDALAPTEETAWTDRVDLGRPAPRESFVNRAGRTVYTLSTDARASALRDAAGDLNPMSLQLWRHLCGRTAWDLVVDVGANYGEMVLSFDLPERATVIAFEPSPDVVACLRQSVTESGLSVCVESLAVGAAAGPRLLFVDPRWSGTSTASPERAREGSRPVTVDGVRLDDYLEARGGETRGCVLIKIDVEGGERDVLEGCATLRGRARELMIQAEILHSTDEDLHWMMSQYVVHLVHKESFGLVPVARVSELREMLSSGHYYAQDAVLATVPTLSLMAPAESHESRWPWRLARPLRAARRAVGRASSASDEVGTATGAAQDPSELGTTADNENEPRAYVAHGSQRDTAGAGAVGARGSRSAW